MTYTKNAVHPENPDHLHSRLPSRPVPLHRLCSTKFSQRRIPHMHILFVALALNPQESTPSRQLSRDVNYTYRMVAGLGQKDSP